MSTGVPVNLNIQKFTRLVKYQYIPFCLVGMRSITKMEIQIIDLHVCAVVPIINYVADFVDTLKEM